MCLSGARRGLNGAWTWWHLPLSLPLVSHYVPFENKLPMRISGTVLTWKHSVACIRLGRVNGLNFWPKWSEERCFFPTKERPWMDPKTPYWVQTYKFHTRMASDTRNFHWSKASCYLLRFSMLQSKTFPYCEIIFELLDDPSARPSVKACR